MSKGSLRLRLLAAGALSILIALSLAGAGLSVLFERHVERRVTAELGIYLDQIVAGLDRNSNGALAVTRPLVDPRFAQPLSGLYWQLRSRSLWDDELRLPVDGGLISDYRLTGPGGAELIVVDRTVKLPQRLGGGIVRAAVAVDAAEITAATRAFGADLLPYLVLLAAFLIAAAYAQVAVGLHPLARLRERLAAIRAGEAHRLGNEFPDEILPLSREFDALLDAREDQLKRARARAADLAHGLKTPLQVLAGDVERLRGTGQAVVADEIEQVAGAMQRHVDRELARARMGTGQPDARAPVGDVIRRVVAVVSRGLRGSELDWQLDLPPGLEARIDPDDLAEAIGNLVENATRHALAKVSVKARRQACMVEVVVADDGPGIPKDQIDRALARGSRLDSLGATTGLGLANVSDIAEAWRGRIDFRSGPGEFGVIFEVEAAPAKS
ncbi:sensor histidine kinase [Rhizobiaceae sp. 2RAB30]